MNLKNTWINSFYRVDSESEIRFLKSSLVFEISDVNFDELLVENHLTFLKFEITIRSAKHAELSWWNQIWEKTKNKEVIL